jgi:hypothetical protein
MAATSDEPVVPTSKAEFTAPEKGLQPSITSLILVCPSWGRWGPSTRWTN